MLMYATYGAACSGMRRPAHVAASESASMFNMKGQDSTVSSGGDVLLRAARTASVVLQTGVSASFSAQGTTLDGNVVLGTGSTSPMTFGGAGTVGSAVDLMLLGQSTTAGHGGDLVLSAGPGAGNAQTGGSVTVDAGTNPVSSMPTEVQVATESVCSPSQLLVCHIYPLRWGGSM